MSLATVQTIPLTLAPDYCPDWTPMTALRELLANAIDTNEPWEILDDHEWQMRTIHSKGRIPISALLMGNSNKAEDSIGRFGEGLKVAALALKRANHNLTIRQNINDACVEKWWFYIAENEVFGHPTIHVERTIYQPYYLDDVTDVYTQIEADGKDFEALFYGTESLLVDQEEFMGHALLECEAFTASACKKPPECDLYVAGLHVKKMPNFYWSYNFNPASITLNRDRNHVDAWELSRVICAGLEAKMESEPESIAKTIGDLVYLTLTKEKAFEDFTYFINYPSTYPLLHAHVIKCAVREANGRPMVDSRSVPITGGFTITSHLGSVIRGGYWANHNGQFFTQKKQDPWYDDLRALVVKHNNKLRRDVKVDIQALLDKHGK